MIRKKIYLTAKKRTSKEIGNLGESIAQNYLLEDGYQIREKNYRKDRGEIDIIVEKNGVIIFVEVKTARSLKLGQPELWVTENKQRQIGIVAEKYISEAVIGEYEFQFDIIGIVIQNNQAELRHYKNAFWL